MKLPFSVSMCVYGKDDPDWFLEAVNSVLDQSYPPSELIIVVDGPLPSELDSIVDSVSQNPIVTLFRFSENKGHGAARRKGLELCSNAWVAIMDADDISSHGRFEKQIQYIEAHPEVTVVGGQIEEFINTPQNVVSRRVVPQKDGDIKSYLKKRCPFNQVTVMFNKDAVEQAGGYLDWYCDEDYYLWCRLYLQGATFANLSDTLVSVRINEAFYGRRGGWSYFKSEAALQAFMLKKEIIGFFRFSVNVTERFILQVALPNSLRSWLFQKLARE